MRRLLALALLCASTAYGQAAYRLDQVAVRLDGQAGGTASYSAIPAPSGCTAGYVGIFLGSPVRMNCDAGLAYDIATDTLSVPYGTVAASNLTATALATPVITPPVSPVLSKFTTITVIAGAVLTDGDYFTLSDGSATVFEFDSNDEPGMNRQNITFVGDETATAIRDLVVIAINASGMAATAVAAGADTLTVTLTTPGSAGGVNSENVANAGFLVPVWGDPTAATTYGYKVACYLADGSHTAASAEVQTTAGHATLSAANYNSITWGAVTGSTSCSLWRVTGGAAPPKLLYSGTLLNHHDVGAGTADTPPATNTTGRLTSTALTSGRVAIVGTGGIVEDSAGLAYNAATSDLTVGHYVNAAGVEAGTGGTVVYNGGVLFNATSIMVWASGSAWGTANLGLARIAPGTLKFTDGASGGAIATVGGVSRAIVDATPTIFATFPIADGWSYTGEITYKIKAVKGTAQQSLKGRVQFSATREGTDYTPSISEMGSQTLAAFAGTLTGSISLSCAAASCALSADFNTSQSSPDSFTIKFQATSVDSDLVLTLAP